ncbi:MAG TPA: hypothetical protein PK629_05215 [Oscillospiraceae bacterium]|nr:hypothetical protein [Oscillospiraceae bacterium]HPF56578.1 hypothetical protein [Clostridiales bacterium]HPK36286.1 hypothetical protein [Oscillospiraceae bacterium]HPR75018.1 hypothetical protein [Oscillospiraceae bacterium]
MTKTLGKTKFLALTAILFIGAVIFLNAPFSNEKAENSVNIGNTVSTTAQENTVTINDEGAAMGIPGESKTGGLNWTVIGIAATVFSLIGAIAVIFLTHEEHN